MVASIESLPSELLRQIIIELLHDIREPHRFYKARLIPLASTSRVLRLASVEFLYWSIDLFEASFGLNHRVLKSSDALRRFNQLIDMHIGFVRNGVRRLLVRDRDGTASGDLWSIVHKLGNLRSLHLDGHFKRPQFPSALEVLLKDDSRISKTLCNLTLLGLDSESLALEFFFRPGVFTNLTRLEYHDTYMYPNTEIDGATRHGPMPTSPFARLRTCAFPSLLIFVFTHLSQPETLFATVVSFIQSHAQSLQRLAVIDKQAVYGVLRRPSPHQLLWTMLPEMKQLRLLGVSVGTGGPTHRLRLPKLHGLFIQHDPRQIFITGMSTEEGNSLSRLCDMLGCPNIIFGDEVNNGQWVALKLTQYIGSSYLLEWVQNHQLPTAKTVGRLNSGAIIAWDVTNTIEKGPVQLMGTSLHEVLAEVGWWSFGEGADKNEPFREEHS